MNPHDDIDLINLKSCWTSVITKLYNFRFCYVSFTSFESYLWLLTLLIYTISGFCKFYFVINLIIIVIV